MPNTEVYELPSYPAPTLVTDPQLRNGIANAKINGAMEIAGGTIFAEALVVGAQTWIHSLVWTATDYNTASWASGAIQFADGSNVSIDAGNTGNISARSYIYYDGSSTLSTTTTYSDAISDERILLAIVDPDTDTSGFCIITAFGAPGTTIDGDKIVTGKIQSIDGNNYYDLNLGRLVFGDGTNPRLAAGDL